MNSANKLEMDFSSLISLGVKIDYNAPLSQWTTFTLGGPCPYLFHCAKPEQIISTVRLLNSLKIPFLLIGGGSNLVVADEGIHCAVIRYVSEQPQITRHGTEVTVSGSTSLHHLAVYTAQEGLEGLIYTSGIPGTVGGAVVGNAGAFGKQVGDVLLTVKLLSVNADLLEVSPQNLGFSYRHSRLKDSHEIVLEATFALKSADRNTLIAEQNEILEIRKAKHPDLKIYPCAGSFFRNIEPTSKALKRQAAGFFLEQAGGKALHCGGAEIYSKHANIIIKTPSCTAKDVYELSMQMSNLVKKAYGFDLIREVRFVGRLPGVAESQNSLVW